MPKHREWHICHLFCKKNEVAGLQNFGFVNGIESEVSQNVIQTS
jgi:Uri superfamily endonuclease